VATTNPSSIRSALETTIAAFTPVGTTFGRSAYQKAAAGWDWAGRPHADRDREFTIEDIPPGKAPWYGGIAEAIVETSLEVVIGHRMSGDIGAGKARRDRDCEHLVRKIEYPSNYPTSVATIHFSGASYTEAPGQPDGAWTTRLRFDVQYLADPDGE
jgi:hypothetical protein